MMVTLTSFLALSATLYAFAGTDRGGRYFHPLMQFQVVGICGAFLTNDLFNLFVFFEVLLIASYALVIHGGGKQRTAVNIHYVILNLTGSSLFLIALGTLYATTGTLNMAHMAQLVGQLPKEQMLITQAGAFLLLIVFGLKAAMLPLHFWLPRTYAAVTAPVAALFAIMTKVGIYCIYRVYTVTFGEHAGELADMVVPWIWPLAFLSMVMGTIGALASPSLRMLAGNLVIVSVGTLLLAFAIRTPEATAAGLLYLVHSTLITGALFLIADMIGQQRGKAFDRFVVARRAYQPALLGVCFFIAALSVAGLPPFSGFLGKLVILQSAQGVPEKFWVWLIILVSSLFSIVALSRAGTTLFWRPAPNSEADADTKVSLWQTGAVILLLGGSVLLVLMGSISVQYTQHAAEQLHDVDGLLKLMKLDGGAQ